MKYASDVQDYYTETKLSESSEIHKEYLIHQENLFHQEKINQEFYKIVNGITPSLINLLFGF